MKTITAPVRVAISRGCLELRKRVTLPEAQRVVELAYHVQLPAGCVMLDFRVLRFLADDVEVRNPVGMECARLEACCEITLGEARLV